MEFHEALSLATMLAVVTAACLLLALVTGRDDWQLFAAVGAIYFCFSFASYLKAYGQDHYSNIH